MKNKFRKLAIISLSALCLGLGTAAIAACGTADEVKRTDILKECNIVNGGFESADLSGWTVESGKAFDDDSVSSAKFFTFKNSEDKRISVNKTGNWYLDGKGFDGRRSHGYTGAIRSEKFVLAGDGSISMKLAGGSSYYVDANTNLKIAKDREKTCYVGVYTAEDDKLVAKFTNDKFNAHTGDFSVSAYENGTYYTDNFCYYSKDLSEYKGRELYLKVVDNDVHNYYGYISVDDIRIGGQGSQVDGGYFVKGHDYVDDIAAPTPYDIKNGDFETGSLAGWTVVEGAAFSHDGVNANEFWWNENITYNRDGQYHYGHYRPSATGVMRSSDFVVAGSGYISYKLGGCRDNDLTYLRFMLKREEGDVEVARFSNFKYWDFQFPFYSNGMKLLNLVQYYADLSAYMGQTMYIEAVDSNTSPDDLACMTLDSVKTYWEVKPEFFDGVAYEAKVDGDLFDFAPATPAGKTYQVTNGGFETGDLTGWTANGTVGVVSSDSTWGANRPYNKKGSYLLTGIADSANKGTLTSSEFEAAGLGISFRLGAASNPSKCYISLVEADGGNELARFGNLEFRLENLARINTLEYVANMVTYYASYSDLGIANGTALKIRITDDGENEYGYVVADSFITYYDGADMLPKNAVNAVNILPLVGPASGSGNANEILNGGFETGDLTGWEITSGSINVNEVIVTSASHWYENISYNRGGLYHFNGFKVNEGDQYVLKSTEFVLGGSGRITFKLGGRTARLKVYDKTEDKYIAVYSNTAFSEQNYPKIDQGCRVSTMTTYVADLSGYLGHTLYIELCNEVRDPALNWQCAFFDDIKVYHGTAPAADSYDTVELNYKTATGAPKSYNIPWVAAVNELS